MKVYLVGRSNPNWKEFGTAYDLPYKTKKEAVARRSELQLAGYTRVFIKRRNGK